ncbi:MAG: TadE/TadG family type IV pilus assembly protein [Candidatus Limnocylindria bacterium]
MKRTSRAQALVEFALIVPIFLLVVVGLFDMGRAVFYYSTISNASREAVRLGIVDQNQTKIRQEAVGVASVVMPITITDVTVQHLDPTLGNTSPCNAAPYEIGCVVRVEVRHTFQPATPFVPVLALKAETHQPIERRYVSP